MMNLVSLRNDSAQLDRFIAVFSSRWGHQAVYRDCMSACINSASPLPQWYLLTDSDAVIGGAGLITNDFNARMDLWPWLAALFVEKKYRGHAYGAQLLTHCRREAARLGFPEVYLITDHVNYYEKYDFTFIGTAVDLFGGTSRIYTAPALSSK